MSLKYNEQGQKIIEIIDYIRKYGFSVFPYEFVQKYRNTIIDVFYDESNNMYYVMYENKRLYYPYGYSVGGIKAHYNWLNIEQDEGSPHRYETEDYSVEDGDAIADIGAAEGIWALHNIEKASKVYLFERNPSWIKALEKTFEPWKEKIIIVNKFVSNKNDKKNVTLDSCFKGERINFIKADIEGMETKMLEGSNNFFKNNGDLKLLLCTYHREGDAEKIRGYFENNGFVIEYSKGCILYDIDVNIKEPYIRRGLIRAKNKTANVHAGD